MMSPCQDLQEAPAPPRFSGRQCCMQVLPTMAGQPGRSWWLMLGRSIHHNPS